MSVTCWVYDIKRWESFKNVATYMSNEKGNVEAVCSKAEALLIRVEKEGHRGRVLEYTLKGRRIDMGEVVISRYAGR